MLSDEVLQTIMFIILPIAAVVILWRATSRTRTGTTATLNLKKVAGPGHRLWHRPVRRHYGPRHRYLCHHCFTSLIGFDLRTANGNGKVLNLASNYASLFTYLMNGLVVFPVGIPCAVSNIVGNMMGSHFALRKVASSSAP